MWNGFHNLQFTHNWFYSVHLFQQNSIPSNWKIKILRWQSITFNFSLYCDQFDPHSAFEYNGGILTTGLHDRLQEKRITVLFLAGLALEYGVFYTAQDAVKRSEYCTQFYGLTFRYFSSNNNYFYVEPTGMSYASPRSIADLCFRLLLDYTTFLVIDATATAKHVSQAPVTIHELKQLGK